jgi:hypothetical protein
MKVVGHQPQYFPYIGFFNKISQGEIFVYADNIQFNSKSWQQRTLIKRDEKELMLTIPVKKKGNYIQNINEVEIIDDGWRRKHWTSIKLAYKKSPYFEFYMKDLEDFYNFKWALLSDFNIQTTNYFIDKLGIKFKKILKGSDIKITGNKTDLLIDICKKTNCDTYISGEGAKVYFDQTKFDNAGLNHIFINNKLIEYNQLGTTFLPGMAIIDILFMYGPESFKFLK